MVACGVVVVCVLVDVVGMMLDVVAMLVDVVGMMLDVVSITAQFIAPVTLDFPALQAVQASLPTPSLYSPGLHGRHAVGAVD